VAIGVSHHQSSLQRKKADSLRWLEWAGLLAGLGCWGWAGPQFFYEWCRQTPFSSVWLVIQPHRRTRIAGAGPRRHTTEDIRCPSFNEMSVRPLILFFLCKGFSVPFSIAKPTLGGTATPCRCPETHKKSEPSTQPLTQPRLTQPPNAAYLTQPPNAAA
jgi:hypothetical protein